VLLAPLADTVVTIGQAIRQVTERLIEAGLPSPREDAELLVRAAVGIDRAFVLSHPELRLSEQQVNQLEKWTELRRDHYPVQYLIGVQEFYGRSFKIDPSVLIPRPETELVVEVSLGCVDTLPDPLVRILDIGTGSGCIAITLACERPQVAVTATDISGAALRVAGVNAQMHGVAHRIEFLQGDVAEPVRDRQKLYHLVVSNPPYVDEDSTEVDQSVKIFEPKEAVFAGPTGLELYEKLFTDVKSLLRQPGWLVLEIGYGILSRVRTLAESTGWRFVRCRKDLAGIDRCALFERADL
jgi:release factor glutamine methyltransferase